MHIYAWAGAVRDNRGMTAPDPTAHSETPGPQAALDAQTVPGCQAALDPQDSPGGRVVGAAHAALAARLVLPIIGIALAGTVLGVAAPDTIAWMILVPAAIVLIVRNRPWRQHLGLRGLGIGVIVGVLSFAYGSLMFTAISHLPVGNAVAISMTIGLLIGVIYGQGKRRFLSLALALAGHVAFAYQASPSTADGKAMQASMMASLWAGVLLLVMAMMKNVESHLGYDHGAVSGVGFVIAALGFGLRDATINGIPALSGRVIAVIIAVSCLIYISPTLLRRGGAQRVDARTEARYGVFYPAAAMLAGGIVLGQVPSLLDLLGLVLVTSALWIMSIVTIVPRRLFGKGGSGAVTAD